jgi:hypothetical protein
MEGRTKGGIILHCRFGDGFFWANVRGIGFGTIGELGKE